MFPTEIFCSSNKGGCNFVLFQPSWNNWMAFSYWLLPTNLVSKCAASSHYSYRELLFFLYVALSDTWFSPLQWYFHDYVELLTKDRGLGPIMISIGASSVCLDSLLQPCTTASEERTTHQGGDKDDWRRWRLQVGQGWRGVVMQVRKRRHGTRGNGVERETNCQSWKKDTNTSTGHWQ